MSEMEIGRIVEYMYFTIRRLCIFLNYLHLLLLPVTAPIMLCSYDSDDYCLFSILPP